MYTPVLTIVTLNQTETLPASIVEGQSLEMQNQCAEIKLRAERRAGELLAEATRRGGDRKAKSNLHDVSLKDVGISHIQSHRWQAVAGESRPDEWPKFHVGRNGKVHAHYQRRCRNA